MPYIDTKHMLPRLSLPRNMLVLGGGISFILGFIGAFNFINVMSVGVMSRRLELATLESIGMGKKQLRSMLRF